MPAHATASPFDRLRVRDGIHSALMLSLSKHEPVEA
jgi:hypothetical protein